MFWKVNFEIVWKISRSFDALQRVVVLLKIFNYFLENKKIVKKEKKIGMKNFFWSFVESDLEINKYFQLGFLQIE